MYKKETENLLEEIEESFNQLRFDNNVLINNPLQRNRLQCLEDIKEMRKYLLKYSEFLKGMLLKYKH